MATKIIMPDLGESVIEGTVVQWLKSEGDTVHAGDALLEVDTDKVTTEIESPVDGILLQITVPQDATIEVGTLVGWVGEAGEQLNGAADPQQSQPSTQTSNQEPLAAQVLQSTHTDGAQRPSRNRKSGMFVSPVVARMAAHHNLDLEQIAGTGRNGRVRKKDVQAYLESPPTQPAKVVAEMGAPATAQDADVLPLTSMRRAIAKRMTLSKQTIPHVTAVVEVDLQKITTHRRAHKDSFAQDGVSLTYMAYFAVAVAQALKAHRIVNSSWSDDGILLHRQVNLGIATDLGERGLIVPVVKNAADLSLLGAAREIGVLAAQARDGALSAAQTRNATYTITNYGSNGTLQATPIIAPPQCAILGLGKIERRPVVRLLDGEEVIVIRPMVYMTHTYDHRILDGGASARFLRAVIEKIENWQ